MRKPAVSVFIYHARNDSKGPATSGVGRMEAREFLRLAKGDTVCAMTSDGV